MATDKIIAYYDGKCGLCRREIQYYQKRVQPEHIIWHDVTVSNDTPPDVSQYDLLLHMHVQKDECLYRGIDAFILLWQHVPGWNWMARLFAFPPIKFIATLAYELFARIRFMAYPHCRIVSKTH